MIYESEYLTGCVIRLDGGLRVPHLWNLLWNIIYKSDVILMKLD